MAQKRLLEGFLFWVVVGLVFAFIVSLAGIYGYLRGIRETQELFVLEKCWLNNKTRDIECITYISD
jgi:hypothetical protein